MKTTTKERPILFSGAMVRAILGGRKTQTRRVVTWRKSPLPSTCEGGQELMNRPSPYRVEHSGAWQFGRVARGRISAEKVTSCPYGVPGDRLWVRETFYVDDVRYLRGPLGSVRPADILDEHLYYPADAIHAGLAPWCCELIPECCCAEVGKPKARSGRFMPRWASRLTLEIVSVRVERVQEISDADAMAEGVNWDVGATCRPPYTGPRAEFASLWDSVNGKRLGCDWKSNPWVWVIEFRRIEGGAA